MNLLDTEPIASIRRNHAIEHATVHILSRMLPHTSMAGRSNSRGFYIYGDLSTETLQQAIREAVDRMRSGEVHLAIHPNCGTNMVTTATLASTATLLASAGPRRHVIDRVLSGLLGALVGVVAGQFVGSGLQQRITTCADLNTVEILAVQRRQFGSRVLHWVHLRHSKQALPL